MTGTRGKVERREGDYSKRKGKESGLERSEGVLEMTIVRPRYCRSFCSKDEPKNPAIIQMDSQPW